MNNEQINVTKTFLPPIEDYYNYIQKIYERCHLTNQGPLVNELESKLALYLNAQNVQYVSNGTIALQLALRALDITEGEIITTPFSYVATTSSILWEKCMPVFVDIEPNNFTIDPDKIEQAITPKTKAIMPVHVFGYACDIEKIDAIAKKYNIKVIYDAAHAFGSKYKGRYLLNFGDISTCSFHSTKIFHTVEGGACIVQDKKVNEKLDLAKKFGHIGDEHFQLGINAKNSEFHAAMGLCNLNYMDKIIEDRKNVSELYDKYLPQLQKPYKQQNFEYNYAYYPVIFESEEQLLKVCDALNKYNIYPRRYFYPSLNKLPYTNNKSCPISEDISLRIVCLPLFSGLCEDVVVEISKIVRESL